MSSDRRKILIVALHYAPDFVGVPKYNTEMAEALRRRGHEVHVVTGLPHYPAWRVPASHAGGSLRRETIGDVDIYRTPLYVPATPGGLKRVLHFLSFGVAATVIAPLRALKIRPDVVFTVAPTLLSAPAALLAARLSGAKSWLHVQDFEIDAAFELGLLKGARSRAFALGLEAWLFKAFDRVSSISSKMVASLERKGVDRGRAIEFRNWVDVNVVQALESVETTYRKMLGIPEGAFVALYSGNMAAKQGLERLAEVAEILEDPRPHIHFLFCGGGPFKAELERLCEGRRNVHFLDLQPIERLSELMATANVHLLPQREEAADLVLPSKLTGMLASGRPVVAMARAGTGLAAEVEGNGIVVDATASAMAIALQSLDDDREACHQLGRNGRAAAERRWRLDGIIDGFEEELAKL